MAEVETEAEAPVEVKAEPETVSVETEAAEVSEDTKEACLIFPQFATFSNIITARARREPCSCRARGCRRIQGS